MLSRLQELKLIALCVAADNRDAFGKLVEAYADDVRRMLFGLTRGNAALVDDLAQETFIKAYVSIRSFKCIARFRTWLFRIAYNEFVSYTRRLTPTESFDAVDTDTEMADESDPVAEAELDASFDGDLQRALSKLSEKERVVTQLFYLEEMNLGQIATVTSMPLGTIKSYLSRSRAKLANELENYRNYVR